MGAMTTTTTFAQLQEIAPDIARPILDRFDASGLAMLGTVRRDGSPRVSPIEVSVHDGHLYIGMMPGSRKALDVGRDPRISLVTAIADRNDLGGEGKLFGRAEPVTDQARAGAVLEAHAEAAGFDPDAVRGSPLFEVVLRGAAWQYVEGDAFVTRSWTEGGPVRVRRREGATGDVVDVVDE